MSLRLAGYGRETKLATPAAAVFQATGDTVFYRRHDVTESYMNGDAGLEQSFILGTRPAGSGKLVFSLAVGGGLWPQIQDRDTILLERGEVPVLRYSGLKAWDATGHALPGSMEVQAGQIRLLVNDAGAEYPVTVDPIVQQAKLTAPDGASGDDFGYSVALNGNTALVGAEGKADFTGAAYVYVQNGTTWTEQAKLTASDGTTFTDFGRSVALSGDTALVGAFETNGSTGAAYVFVRNGTAWTQQAKLTVRHGQTSDQFGYSVSLDGNTAVIGAPQTESLNGAAYIYLRSGTTWTQHAALLASDGAPFDDFGGSVAISGTTAIVGARYHASNGAAYVFIKSGSSWILQAKLVAPDGAANDEFGSAVGLSGTSAIVGAYNNLSGLGAAYVFVRSGGKWTEQVKLTALNGQPGDSFGFSVAISGDVALVGAPYHGGNTGAAYFFIRSGTVWVQQAKFNALDSAQFDEFGYSVAWSGNTGVTGAPFKANSTGAAYAFAAPLLVIGPASGTPGAAITVSGSGFVANETVYVVWNSPHFYLGSATSDATGSFTGFAATVPATAQPGLNIIYGHGATGNDQATGYFTVQ